MSSLISPPAGSQTQQDSETHNMNSTPVTITPSTPPRGRQASRYPSTLSAGDSGRVPLHRRGTSKTYERLEDLLREAGYKETRVFTPEAERAEARAEEKRKREAYNEVQRSGARGGVGAVMDFLAGWMQGTNREDDHQSSDSESVAEDSQTWGRSLPPSPLAHRRMDVSDSDSSLVRSPLMYSSPGPRPLDSHHLLPHANPRALRALPSASENLRTYAQVSAARGYLRHMASAPNMPKVRDNSILRRPSTATHDTPPLPTKWLESVTKAVLGSSADVHIGGPRPSSRQSPRTGRSTIQSSALFDRTNRHRPPPRRELSSSGAPHALTAYLNHPRTAPNAVTTVRVVCRSAPASRSSSRAGERLAMSSDMGSLSGHRASRNKAKTGKSDGVPSLASTRLENDDAWAVQWVDGIRVSNASEDDYDDNEDEEEGEIDLARLLVPPKRQHSIRSLRRHLHRSESVRALRADSIRALDPWAADDDNSTKSQSLRGRSRRDTTDDGDGHGYGWEAMGMPGFDQVGAKRRRSIPGHPRA